MRCDEVSYWLAVPRAGPVRRMLQDGRTEMMRMLRRSKFGELFMADLLRRRIRSSQLPNVLHILDLIGAQMAQWYAVSTYRCADDRGPSHALIIGRGRGARAEKRAVTVW